MFKAIEGKKTYILLAIYCVLVLFNGAQGSAGMDLSNIDVNELQQVVLASAFGTFKAMFQRSEPE